MAESDIRLMIPNIVWRPCSDIHVTAPYRLYRRFIVVIIIIISLYISIITT